MWWLRAQLRFRPQDWLVQVPAAAIAAVRLDRPRDRATELADRANPPCGRSAGARWRWSQVPPSCCRRNCAGALVRIFAYLGAICALSVIATEFFKQPDVAEIRRAGTASGLDRGRQSVAGLSARCAGFRRRHAITRIRRHAEGGGRKDILSFGELGNTQRFMSVEIYRAGQEIGRFGTRGGRSPRARRRAGARD